MPRPSRKKIRGMSTVVSSTSSQNAARWRTDLIQLTATWLALFLLLLNGGFMVISPWFIPSGPADEVARME